MSMDPQTLIVAVALCGFAGVALLLGVCVWGMVRDRAPAPGAGPPAPVGAAAPTMGHGAADSRGTHGRRGTRVASAVPGTPGGDHTRGPPAPGAPGGGRPEMTVRRLSRLQRGILAGAP